MNSLKPIIEALETAHRHFNAALFGGRLKGVPVITVQTRGRRAAYGWYWPAKWSNETETPAELNLSAEDLKRPSDDVLLTLAHEMVHQAAAEAGIKDCSRNGRYHNRRFAELARGAGLVPPSEPDKRLGFSCATWGDGRLALDSLDSNVGESFKLARRLAAPGKQKGRMRLYVCACGFKIRCGREDLRAKCLECEGEFERNDVLNGGAP